MALPNSNISTSLVGTTLGVPTRDVGQLCLSSAVNKWSKWKPVRWNKVDGITLANLEAINYGLTYNSYANIDAIKTAYEANEEVMPYAKPRGGLYNEPYRLGDFRNYEHSAIAPITGGFVTAQVQNIEGGQTSIMGSVMVNGSPKTTEIGWDDLNLDQRKLALALYDGATLVKTAVADSAGDMEVIMDSRYPLPVLSEKTYKAYLFFTNNAGTTTSALIGIPNHPTNGFSVEVVGQTVLISVEAKWSVRSPNDVDIAVKGINNSGSSVSLTNCTMRVRNSANICTSIMQQGEINAFVPSTLTLPPSATPVTLHTTVVTVDKALYPSWKVCWSNTGTHPNTFEANIIQGI